MGGDDEASDLSIRGARYLPGFLDPAGQAELVAALRRVAAAAPFFHPETRWGRKMSVRMTSAGSVGWISDRKGYRYDPVHPGGGDWPSIPERLVTLWRDVTGLERDPDTCLVNYYGEGAKMGMHQDRDEASFDWPVLSLSLGDDALFRMGGAERGGATESIWLKSGDVIVLEGTSRLAHHGIDRIRFGSSRLLESGGRLNVTLRVAL